MGARKKFLLCLFSTFFVLGVLITPSPKNTSIYAAECEVVDAKIIPSSTGTDSDSLNTNTFYKNRPTTGAEVKIKVAVQNCKDYSVSATLIEGGNIDDEIKGYVDNLTKATGKEATKNIGPYLNFKDDQLITATFNFLAGDEKCSVDATFGYSDCHYDFKIYAKKEISSSYSINNGKELYDSTKDELWGNLYYDRDDPLGSENREKWVYLGGSTEVGNQAQKQWFYQLKEGKWFNSGATTQKECEDLRNVAGGSKREIPCRVDPPTGELAEGTVSGRADAVPECSLINPLNLPACVTTIAYHIIFVPISILAGLAGNFFDALFDFSISSAIYGGGGASVGFLKVAWTFIRDLCNLGFIITLLWISIKQILSPTGYDAKKQLPAIIIIALVINFSYFFGTVIIDTTNVLARFLSTNDVICVNTNGKCDGTISEGIVAAFNPQVMIQKGSAAYQEATGKSTMDVSFYAIMLILSIWVSWKMFMMFFKIGTLFIGRVVQLWVHLVLSPVAFINMILPTKIGMGKTVGGSINGPKEWAAEFFKNAFIAPLFMFFLYLIFLLISGFDFVKTSFETRGHSDFLVLITMIFPFFVLTILMEKAVEHTQSQAGNIATALTGKINSIVGAVAGTALALTGGAAMGALVKGGSRALGSLSKGMIAGEGKGSNMVSRKLYSAQAKLGGRINQYSKDLPDKNFDIRNSKLSDRIKNATGFDMKTDKDNVNKYLAYAGLRPSETFSQKKDRKAKNEEADVERRKIDEKTDKMDVELAAIHKKRTEELESKAFDQLLEKAGVDRFNQYSRVRKAAGATDDEIKKDFINSNANKQTYDSIVKEYKIKTSGSEAMFDAKNREEYTKAAKSYNNNVDKAFVMKKKRDVYGGKNADETEARFKNDQKSGLAGVVNNADAGIAGAQAGGVGVATSVIGAGVAATAGLAGGVLYASEAAYKRDGDLEFLRRRENKRKDDDKKTKTKAKIESEIEDKKIIGERLAAKIEELSKSLDKHTKGLIENSATFKTSTGEQTKAFKDFFKESLEKIRKESPDASENLINLKSFNEAHGLYTDHVNQKISEFNTIISQAKDSEKQIFNEFETFQKNNPNKSVPKDLEQRYADAEKRLAESIPGIQEQRDSLERHMRDITARKNQKISMEEDFEKVYDRKTKNDNIIETLSKKKDDNGTENKKAEEKKDDKK